MENSADCLGRVGGSSIWAMQRLNVSYSVWFTWRPYRSGHCSKDALRQGATLVQSHAFTFTWSTI